MLGLNFRKFGFHADYFSDHLVRVYSSWIFVTLAAVVSIAMTCNGAITCWVPARFTGPASVYTNDACLRNARLLPLVEFIPGDMPPYNDNEALHVSKYRSFPIMLLSQALLFFLPWLLWRIISGGACNLDAVIREASRMPITNTIGIGSSIGGHLQKLIRNPCSILGGAAGGYVLSLSYLFIKFLCWIICFVQMAAIAAYFDINFFTFKTGQPIWESHIQRTRTNTTSVSFPRKVLCDLKVRSLGNVHRYTLQCSLGISEKIENCLTIIWVWLILVLVILSFSGAAQLLHTIMRCVGPVSYSKRFLKQRLCGVASFNSASTQVIQKFCQMYLKPDMFFIIGMIEENGSISAASLGLKELWEEFLNTGKIHTEHGEMSAEDVRPIGPGVTCAGTPGAVNRGQQASAPSSGPYTALQSELKPAEAQM